MRVLFFITKSEAGGAQTHVADLTAWLVQHGHTVWVMSTPGGWLEDETKRTGATFIPNRSLGNTANPFRLFSAAQTLKKAAHDLAPDLVTCHSTMAGLIGRFTIHNTIPTVFTAHGWSFTQGTKWYRRLFLPMIERLAAQYCSKIICVSQNDLRLAKKFKIAPEKKLTMIYNGIEKRPIDSTDASLEMTNGTEGVNIIFIGRLAAPKNPWLLLRALPEGCHLTIVGDGPQKKEIIEEIKKLHLNDRVTLTGALPRQEVLKHLISADVFVLPTRYEGLPYTVLEAMAHGLPVIASDVGGIKEAVGDDAGIVVPSNDSTALTNALKRLILNPELRQTMGKAGLRKTQTIFSDETMCKTTLAVYQEALTKHHHAKALL